MQHRFIKSLVYVVTITLVIILFLSQTYNFFCRVSDVCKPVLWSSLMIHKIGTKEINYKFIAKISDQLKNKVEFNQNFDSKKALNGEEIKNFYYIKNLTPDTIVVRSKYDLSVKEADIYLQKIQCLCAQEQILKPGEKTELPIIFRMSSEIEEDKLLKNIKELEITYEIELVS